MLHVASKRLLRCFSKFYMLLKYATWNLVAERKQLILPFKRNIANQFHSHIIHHLLLWLLFAYCFWLLTQYFFKMIHTEGTVVVNHKYATVYRLHPLHYVLWVILKVFENFFWTEQLAWNTATPHYLSVLSMLHVPTTLCFLCETVLIKPTHSSLQWLFR